MTDAPLRRHPDAAFRNYDGDAFIVSPGLGEYNILNVMGSRIWELIDGTRGVAEIVKIIVEEYDVTAEQAEADVRTFVEDLRKHQIIS